MQFQADMLGVTVDRPEIVETTAMGAAFLAGLGCGIWKNKDELRFARQTARLYKPSVTSAERASALSAWHEAVRRTVSNI
ncbi:MAG: glycerol kinase, partial [Clostridia bacterium]|nr:glycerol kinase [Clostridia bacterium]